MPEHMQIGEVAEVTGLSLRTIRHYEDVGLVLPTARTKGGFRLYTDEDVARLRLVRAMKPLEFTLEEMRDLLAVLDGLGAPAEFAQSRDELVDRLAMYRTAAVARVRGLRDQLAVAEGFAELLGDEIDRHGEPRDGRASRPRSGELMDGR